MLWNYRESLPIFGLMASQFLESKGYERSQFWKTIRQKAWNNTLSQIDHINTFKKGKVIAISSVEIKILRIEEKIQLGGYP